MKTKHILSVCLLIAFFCGSLTTTASAKPKNNIGIKHLIYSPDYPHIITAFQDGNPHTIILIETDDSGRIEVRIWKGSFSEYPDGVYLKKDGIFERREDGFMANATFVSEVGEELEVSGWFPLKKEGLLRGDVYGSLVFITKSTGYHPKSIFTTSNEN